MILKTYPKHRFIYKHVYDKLENFTHTLIWLHFESMGHVWSINLSKYCLVELVGFPVKSMQVIPYQCR